jgi:hypothetical protein
MIYIYSPLVHSPIKILIIKHEFLPRLSRQLDNGAKSLFSTAIYLNQENYFITIFCPWLKFDICSYCIRFCYSYASLSLLGSPLAYTPSLALQSERGHCISVLHAFHSKRSRRSQVRPLWLRPIGVRSRHSSTTLPTSSATD